VWSTWSYHSSGIRAPSHDGLGAIFSRAKAGDNIGGILLAVAPRTPASGQISQVERAYQEIKWRIVYGHYKPGAHLSEATLARVHRTSRTPIREALARLSEEQYVVWDAGRGFLIAPVTVSRIRDTFHVRRLLEGAAAAGAGEMATPNEIRAMAGLAGYHYTVGDADSYRAALARNLEFHLAVAAASHNEVLVDLVRQCLMQTDRVLSLGVDYKPFEEGSTGEHDAVVAAVEKRDAAGARDAMERHVDRTGCLMMSNVLRGGIRGVAL
jgi:DNA-binding GntR family transcriptional regulator